MFVHLRHVYSERRISEQSQLLVPTTPKTYYSWKHFLLIEQLALHDLNSAPNQLSSLNQTPLNNNLNTNLAPPTHLNRLHKLESRPPFSLLPQGNHSPKRHRRTPRRRILKRPLDHPRPQLHHPLLRTLQPHIKHHHQRPHIPPLVQLRRDSSARRRHRPQRLERGQRQHPKRHSPHRTHNLQIEVGGRSGRISQHRLQLRLLRQYLRQPQRMLAVDVQIMRDPRPSNTIPILQLQHPSLDHKPTPDHLTTLRRRRLQRAQAVHRGADGRVSREGDLLLHSEDVDAPLWDAV